jgi:large subunit ribosomal protein L31
VKKNTHPTYYKDAQATCVCGNTFTIGSTLEKMNVDVCSKCHPFFTGEMRFADTKGKIDAFMKKREAAAKHKQTQAKKKEEKQKKQEHKSLKDMLTVTKLDK